MAEILLRSQWSVVDASFSELGVPSAEAVQHHTGGAGPGNDLLGYLRNLEAGEMRRGDGLIALAYHWLVVNDGPHKGTRVEVRPWHTQGGATLNHNTRSRAVVLTGDFTNERVTPEGLDSLGETWADCMRGGFVVPDPNLIQPHSLYFQTACCGTHLKEQLPALRATVLDKLTPGEPIDWHAVFVIAAWAKRLAEPEKRGPKGKRITGPLRRGDQGPDVLLLAVLLHQAGYLKHVMGDVFGRRMSGAVRRVKRDGGYEREDIVGDIFAGRAAAQLLHILKP